MSHGYVRTKDIRDGVVTSDKLSADIALGSATYTSTSTVDNSVIDTALTASAKVFSTIKLAVAAAEAAGESFASITVLTSDTPHVWDGTDSGYIVDSSLTVELIGASQAQESSAVIEMSGQFPDPLVSVFPAMVFTTISVVQTGAGGFGNERQPIFTNVTWDNKSTRSVWEVQGVDFTSWTSWIFSPNFKCPTGEYAGVILSNSYIAMRAHCTAPGFENFAYIDAAQTYYQSITNNIQPFYSADTGVPGDIVNAQCTIDVKMPSVLSLTCFDGKAGAALNRGVQFRKERHAGATVLLYDAGTTLTVPSAMITWDNNAATVVS